jgi:hypothetical protein
MGDLAARTEAVYRGYMDTTTIKVSVETRDRIKSFGGATYEDTIVEALDLLDSQQFWAEADAAVAARRALPDAEQRRIAAVEAAVDASFDGIE